jgi:hypothetical protein
MNPVCGARFLSPQHGKLYRNSRPAARSRQQQQQTSSSADYAGWFWLCEPCSQYLTLRPEGKRVTIAFNGQNRAA